MHTLGTKHIDSNKVDFTIFLDWNEQQIFFAMVCVCTCCSALSWSWYTILRTCMSELLGYFFLLLVFPCPSSSPFYSHVPVSLPLFLPVFIYSCPGFKSSIKERMLYSSCKEPLLSVVESNCGILIGKKVSCIFSVTYILHVLIGKKVNCIFSVTYVLHICTYVRIHSCL